MGTKEDITQAFRAFAKAYSISGTPLTNEQVIPADDDGPRPASPYLVVNVLVSDIAIGRDELLGDLDGVTAAPEWKQRGQRLATVEIQGFGSAAGDWLGRLAMSHLLPAAVAIFDAATIDVSPMAGGIRDLSAMLDTSIEDRSIMEWEVTYELTTDSADAEAGVELEHVILTTTHDEDLPSEWTRTDTIDL